MKVIYTWALIMAAFVAYGQGISTIDYANSAVTFKIKNAGISVTGAFKEYTATLQFDPKNLSSSYVEGRIKTNSISTGINGRDNHLRKEEFFYVDKYPDIKFKSVSIKQQGAGYVVLGKLTIKDVTKDVSLPITVAKSGTVEVFEGKLTVNRLDFHVGEDSWVMSDDVLISIKITTK